MTAGQDSSFPGLVCNCTTELGVHQSYTEMFNA